LKDYKIFKGLETMESSVILDIMDGDRFRGGPTMNESATNKRTLLIMIVVILISLTLAVTGIAPITSKIGYFEDGGATHWSANYLMFEGSSQRNVDPGEGSHNLEVEVNTKSGIINLQIIGTDGTVFYSGNKIPTSSFEVAVTEKVSILVHTQAHRGGFSIKW
jgi:hypothetical protein